MGTGERKVMGIYKHALLTLGLGRAACVGSVQAHAYLYICSDHRHRISCAGGAGSKVLVGWGLEHVQLALAYMQCRILSTCHYVIYTSGSAHPVHIHIYIGASQGACRASLIYNSASNLVHAGQA